MCVLQYSISDYSQDLLERTIGLFHFCFSLRLSCFLTLILSYLFFQFFFFLLVPLETESYSVVRVGLESMVIILSWPLQCWVMGGVLRCPVKWENLTHVFMQFCFKHGDSFVCHT